jgi:hypothetical protein
MIYSTEQFIKNVSKLNGDMEHLLFFRDNKNRRYIENKKVDWVYFTYS